MNIALVLLILLVGTIVTFLSTNRLARITAMIFAIASLVFSVALFFKGTHVDPDLAIVDKSFRHLFRLDGLSFLMTILTTTLLPLILLTATSRAYKRENYFIV